MMHFVLNENSWGNMMNIEGKVDIRCEFVAYFWLLPMERGTDGSRLYSKLFKKSFMVVFLLAILCGRLESMNIEKTRL